MILLCCHGGAGTSLMMGQLAVMGCYVHNDGVSARRHGKHPWGAFQWAKAWQLQQESRWDELVELVQRESLERPRTAFKWCQASDQGADLVSRLRNVTPLVLWRRNRPMNQEWRPDKRLAGLEAIAETHKAPVFEYDDICSDPMTQAQRLADALPFDVHFVQVDAAARLVRRKEKPK